MVYLTPEDFIREDKTAAEILSEIKIKKLPNCLNEKNIHLHRYIYRIKLSNPDDSNAIHLQKYFECQHFFSMINNVGICLPFLISIEILNNIFKVYFGEQLDVNLSIECIGEKELSEHDYKLVKLFHLSTYHSKDVLLSLNKTLIVEKNMNESLLLSIDKDISDYFSLNNIEFNDNLLLIPLPFVNEPKSFNHDILNSNELYSTYLHSCAYDAQVLAHNLNVYTDMTESKKLTQASELKCNMSSESVALLNQDSILLNYAGNLQCAINDSHNNQISLDSIMLDYRKKDETSQQSYYEYYMEKYSIENKVIIQEMHDSNSINDKRLMAVITLQQDLKPKNLLRRNNIRIKKTITHVVPKLCVRLGNSLYYYILMYMPSITRRISSLLLSEEYFFETNRKVAANSMKCCKLFDVNFLTAITPKMTEEGTSSERLR